MPLDPKIVKTTNTERPNSACGERIFTIQAPLELHMIDESGEGWRKSILEFEKTFGKGTRSAENTIEQVHTKIYKYELGRARRTSSGICYYACR